jgi:hypothetical protein
MTDEIAGPKAGGAFIAPRDHLNHLVIFTKVHKVETRYDQKRKQDGEVLTVDFHCFNCDNMAEPDERLLGHPWVGSKVQRDGRLTLGYITQLPATNGNSDGAFVLSDPRPEDFKPVQDWWEGVKAARAQRELSGPSQPPAQGGWGGAPAQDPPQAAAPWGQSAAPAPAPAASAPPAQSSGGAGWGTPPPPTPPPAPAAPVNPPTPDQVRAMPVEAVQALIAQGVLTADQVRTVRNDV